MNYGKTDWTDYIQKLGGGPGGEPPSFRGGGYEIIVYLNYCTNELAEELDGNEVVLPIGEEAAYQTQREEEGLTDFQARILSWCSQPHRIDAMLGQHFDTTQLKDIIAIFANHSE